MERVVIVGPCGAGKSTLGFALARRQGLPLVHMDKLGWQPGWVDRSTDEVRAALEPIIVGDRWLIEGNYGATLADRLARADTAIFLDYSIPLCLARILRRVWHYRGRTRPEMTEGCPERLHVPFLLYAATWGGRPRRKLLAALSGFEGEIIRLGNPRATDRWLDTLSPDNAALANTAPSR